MTGSVPSEVFLLIEQEGRFQRDEEVRMMPREGEKGVFTFRFRNVQRGMKIHPRGGDDPGTALTTEILVSAPPSVDRLIATMTPPRYTGLPTVREERQEFRVPTGTLVDLEIETSGAVTEGRVTQNNDPNTELVLQADPENPSTLLHSFVVEESGTFNLHLTAGNGFRNIVPLDYVITMIPDRRPTVEILQPGISDLEVTDRAVVPFRLLVSDDYGLTRVALRLGKFELEDAQEIDLEGPDGGALTIAGGTKTPLQMPLDLLTFQMLKDGIPAAVSEGEKLAYQLVAQDNMEDADGNLTPNEYPTQLRFVDLISETAMSRKLADRQLRIKNSVSSLSSSQEGQARRCGRAARCRSGSRGGLEW